MVVQPEEIDWGECSNEGCKQPTPMDMVGIILGERIYCSPDCAKECVSDHDFETDDVALHDPQYSVDREQHGLNPKTIDIIREGPETPTEKIEACTELYGAGFRVIDVN